MNPRNFSETALTRVLADVSDPVSVISNDYRILWANNAVLRYLSTGIEQIRGDLCFEVIFRRSRRCPECPIRLVFDSGRPSVMEKCFISRHGSVIWREVRAYPVRDVNGSIVAVIRIGFDITEQKRLRDRQRKQVEELESALRALRDTGTDEPVGHPRSRGAFELTPREMHVLRLLAKGLTNRQISGILCISHNTVKSHVAHIFNKLGVARRAEAAAKALRLTLL